MRPFLHDDVHDAEKHAVSAVRRYIVALRKHCPVISVSDRSDAIMAECETRMDAAETFLAEMEGARFRDAERTVVDLEAFVAAECAKTEGGAR